MKSPVWMEQAHHDLQRRRAPGAFDMTLKDDLWSGVFVHNCFAATSDLPMLDNPRDIAAWQTWGVASEPVRGAVLVFRRPDDPAPAFVGLMTGATGAVYAVLTQQGQTVMAAEVPKAQLLAARWPAEPAEAPAD